MSKHFVSAFISLVCGFAWVVAMPAGGQTLEWVRQFGTSEDDRAVGVALTGPQSIYIAGSLDATNGIVDEPNSKRVFIDRRDRDGQLQWAREISLTSGIGNYVVGGYLAADDSGNAYILGHTDGALGESNAGGTDLFLAKYDSAGNQLWLKQFGSDAEETSAAISIDRQGNVLVGGQIYRTDQDDYNGMISKFDANGSHLWTREFGTDSNDFFNDVVADNLGNTYLSGDTFGTLGDVHHGSNDGVLLKLDPNGQLLWKEQFGTSSLDQTQGVWVDESGDVFVTGMTRGNLDGPYGGGLADMYVRKYDSTGSLIWGRQIGDAITEVGQAVWGDNRGSLFLGSWSGTRSEGVSLSRYDSDSGELDWTEEFGTAETDALSGFVGDGSGGLFLVGFSRGVLAEPGAGENDAFLAKLSYPIAPLPGDFNLDGTVDARDYTVWRNGLGTEYTVDDYHLWKDNYGRGTAAALPLASVPEPATASLLLLGALGSCLVCRARKEFPKKSPLFPTGSSPFCG